jgi:class 3 adenylate cyclase
MESNSAATFLFADIAGFTALTEAHGDEHAVALVEEFAEAVSRELPPIRGQHVKTIGDAVMVRVPDPGDAIQLGLRITHDLIRGHEAPAVRVGLNYGTAVERGGDYFGTTINIAARVSALASGGEVLVTGATAALAPDLDGVYYESRGRQALRNVSDPLEIFAAFPTQKTDDLLSVDPVCRMAVDRDKAVGRLTHDSRVYFFCSLTCAATFAQNPERYAV